MRHFILKMKRSAVPVAWSLVPHPMRRISFIVVAGLAVGLQLTDTGLDLNQLAAADTASANAAGLVGVFEFVFGCLAAILFQRL